MNSVYNKRYYEEYDVGVASVDYSTSQYTKAFLESIAERIVNDLQPKTVLDAGCAMGHLVAALRDRGVEAYGIDISEYAVTHAREDIREYCFQGSLAEPMPEGMYPQARMYPQNCVNEQASAKRRIVMQGGEQIF